MAEDGHRAVHVVEVVERLAHAHEDEVDRLAAARPEIAHQGQDLTHDLAGREVAHDAHGAGGAESTAQGAAHLARNAVGDAVIRLVPRHVDGLDAIAVRETEHQLRGAVVRGMALEDHGQRLVRVLVEPGADRPLQEELVRQPGANPLEPGEDVRRPPRAALGLEIVGQERPRRGRTLPLGSPAVPGHGGGGNCWKHLRSLADCRRGGGTPGRVAFPRKEWGSGAL
jgi:hypothetical protein